MFILEILAALGTAVGFGVLYRMRGGLFGDKIGWGSTTARLAAWGLPCALLMWALGLPLLFALLFGAAAFAGVTIGNFNAIDLGSKDGTFSRDFVVLSMRGFGAACLLALVLWLTHHTFWPVMLAGAMQGMLYYIAMLDPIKIKGFGYGDGAYTGYDFPETGEFYFGIIMALGMILSMV